SPVSKRASPFSSSSSAGSDPRRSGIVVVFGAGSFASGGGGGGIGSGAVALALAVTSGGGGATEADGDGGVSAGLSGPPSLRRARDRRSSAPSRRSASRSERR